MPLRDELLWFVTHSHATHGAVGSAKAADDIVFEAHTLLGSRPMRSGFLTDESFDSYRRDYDLRGQLAIASGGLWGRVNGARIELTAASGYRAHQWWVPRVNATITAVSGGGSMVIYRLRSIQSRHVFVTVVMVAFGITFLALGLGLVVSGANRTGGCLSDGFGVLVFSACVYWIHIAAPIAIGMTAFLETTIDGLANG